MRDPTKIWHKFPYLVVEEDIARVVNKWPSDWLTPSDASVGNSKATEGSTAQMMAAEKNNDAQ